MLADGVPILNREGTKPFPIKNPNTYNLQSDHMNMKGVEDLKLSLLAYVTSIAIINTIAIIILFITNVISVKGIIIEGLALNGFIGISVILIDKYTNHTWEM